MRQIPDPKAASSVMENKKTHSKAWAKRVKSLHDRKAPGGKGVHVKPEHDLASGERVTVEKSFKSENSKQNPNKNKISKVEFI